MNVNERESIPMRLRLEYGDHNVDFERVLPQTDRVLRRITSVDLETWFLFHLDTTIEYDGRFYKNLLLKSRWMGHHIGQKEPTSVFILLVPDAAAVQTGFSPHDLYHVAWGVTHTL